MIVLPITSTYRTGTPKRQPDGRFGFGADNDNYNMAPWDHHKYQGEKHQCKWSNLDRVYDWHIKNPTAGRLKAGHVFGFHSEGTFRQVVEWVKANGNPRLNADWMLKYREVVI